jgi:hypothetical protein
MVMRKFRRQEIEVPAGLACKIILGITAFLALTTYDTFMRLLGYIDMIIYPWNYLLILGLEGGSLILSYGITDNWVEAWAAKDRRAKVIQFTNSFMLSGVLIIAGVGTVMTLLYLGGSFDWIFYANVAIIGMILIVGTWVSAIVKHAKLPAILKKAKRLS